jgi:hypothetical protein
MTTENAKQKMKFGWTSTKLHLALITMALVTCIYGFMKFPVDKFDVYCFTLISAAGIYAGSNVAATLTQKSKAEAPVDAP